jgi:uncharacterized membrane protein
METRELVALSCVIMFVVGINLVLVMSYRRNLQRAEQGKSISPEIELIQKAFRHVRNPMEKDQQDLQELSQLVRQLEDDQTKKGAKHDSLSSE